jgi:hypothetical protein
LKSFGLANDAGKGPLANVSEPLPHFFRNSAEIRHHHLRLALEPSAQFLILGGDSDGASVEMALPRHHAPECNERRGAESKFVGAEKCGHDYIAA